MAFKKVKVGGGSDVKMTAPLLDAGPYQARVVQIIDLGKQHGSVQYPDPQYKLMFKFELLDEFMLNEQGEEMLDKPRHFAWELAYNPDGYMHEKSTMFKVMQVLNPDLDLDLVELLTKPCTVLITEYTRKSGKHAGESANKINGIAKMKAKDVDKAPALVNPTIFFDMDEPDLEVFKSLPFGNEYAVQERIKAGMEFKGSKLAKLLGDNSPEEPDVDEEAPEEAPFVPAIQPEDDDDDFEM